MQEVVNDEVKSHGEIAMEASFDVVRETVEQLFRTPPLALRVEVVPWYTAPWNLSSSTRFEWLCLARR